MRLHIASLLLCLLCYLTLLTTPAMAGYTSGPPNGNLADPGINQGNAVSDSYTLSPPTGTVSSLTFTYWDPSSTDLLTSVDVQFGSTPFGGSLTTWVIASNSFLLGPNQCTPSPTCSGQAFTLVRSPSTTYEVDMTSIPAESFTLTGPGGTTPEPSSIMLFGSGILGMLGFLRRSLRG